MPLLLSLSCGGSPDRDSVKKKTMENLYYAYEEDAEDVDRADTSLTNILELYSLDPEIFGDPVRIVSEFEDSLTLVPLVRRTALIVIGPMGELPEGIRVEEIAGGTVLTYSCRDSIEGIDDCWARIGRFAENRGYECIPPGIELFKDFGAESYPDTSVVELIVRIK